MRAIDLLVLAGYLKLVPAAVIARYRGRIINIHPALLPGVRRAGHVRPPGAPGGAGRAARGRRGATVHLVDEVYDRGEHPGPGAGAGAARGHRRTARRRGCSRSSTACSRRGARRRRGGPPGPAPETVESSRDRTVMPRALISVSDKRGDRRLRPGAGRARLGDHLDRRHRRHAPRRRGAGASTVEKVTGFPELLDGRVKTLHPAIHGGAARPARPARAHGRARASTGSCRSTWWR